MLIFRIELGLPVVTWNKKSHIKMFKAALFDCAINEKCCCVDGGRGICPLFSSPPRGIWQLKSPHPREFAIRGKKNANARGSARGRGLGAAGVDWYISFNYSYRYEINLVRVIYAANSSILRGKENTGPILGIWHQYLVNVPCLCYSKQIKFQEELMNFLTTWLL